MPSDTLTLPASQESEVTIFSIFLYFCLLFLPENFEIKMELWSETLDLNSELSQFDIDGDDLADPSLPTVTVPLDIPVEVEL